MNNRRYIKGLVSVVIPTYKRSDMLLKAIDSVLSQSYRNIELIVVNDNEVGDQYSLLLYEMLKDIHDERFLFIEQEKHINGAAARNAGIRKARGEYIAFQDDDDYWDLNKIEKQVALLSSLDSSYGAVVCLKKFYNNGLLVSASLPFSEKNMLLHMVEGTVSLGTGAVLIRREALDNSGYFDESLNRHQDLQLFVRLASKYNIKLDKVYMQNREVKDTQNRPTAERIKGIKEAYFTSVRDIIEKYPERVQKTIYAIHNYEVAYCYLREKQYKKGIEIALSVLKSPSAVFLAIKMTGRKLIGTSFKRILVQKYDNHQEIGKE